MQKPVTGSNGERVVEPDVVVVGGGGAGLAAASAAAELGARVVLIEKGASLGGSTAWSVGSITATGTPHQRRAGIADSTDAHFEDLGLLAGNKANRDNPALRRILVDEHQPKAFDWLLSTGLVFTGPNAEPPHRYSAHAQRAAQLARVSDYLGRHCRRLGVDIRSAAAAERMLVEDGRVSWRGRRAGRGVKRLHSRRGAAWCWPPATSAPTAR